MNPKCCEEKIKKNKLENQKRKQRTPPFLSVVISLSFFVLPFFFKRLIFANPLFFSAYLYTQRIHPSTVQQKALGFLFASVVGRRVLCAFIEGWHGTWVVGGVHQNYPFVFQKKGFSYFLEPRNGYRTAWLGSISHVPRYTGLLHFKSNFIFFA